MKTHSTALGAKTSNSISMFDFLHLMRNLVFGFFLKIFWEPFSKKRSHWWNWKTLHRDIYLPHCARMAGNRDAKNGNSKFSNFFQTNFVWKRVVIMTPWDRRIPFKIGFISRIEREKKICDIRNKPGQLIGVLVGPDDVEFFALDSQGGQLELRVIEFTTKNDLPSGTMLL